MATAGAQVGSTTSTLLSTPISRARPAMPRQSARFGVRSTSMLTSLSARYSRISVPMGASSGSSMMPSASTSMPSSLKEQSMPWDGWPRSLAFLMVKSPGRVAPTLATHTLRPARQFGAPQTMSSSSSSPTLTLVTRSLSASGCWAHSTTSPTTTLLNWPATASTASTSRPAMVICSASALSLNSVRTHSITQDLLNFMFSRPYLNCLRKRRSFSKKARRSLTP